LTLIVAWRDPFCMVSDDLETSDVTRVKSSVGPKMAAIADSSLILGFAGPKEDYESIVEQVSKLPAADWDTFEMATRKIIDDLNEDRSCKRQATVVVAGMIGGISGIFDSVGMPGIARTRKCAFAGSGGIVACAAKGLATRYCRDPDEAMGEELLRTIVEAGGQADEWSGKPIHRIDFDRLRNPYVWLPYE
jgi:ATP-dependent protease HslVU (ClpYQ) peptidase subunit